MEIEFNKHFDSAFIKSIFNMRDIVLPMTWRRVAIWGLYCAFAGAYYQLHQRFAASRSINQALHDNILAVTLLTYGFEPALLMIYMLMARYPHFEAKPTKSRGRQQHNKDTVLIIPCHLSVSSQVEKASFEKVLSAALKHFLPSNILLIDNGQSSEPLDNTKEVAHNLDRHIQYYYYAYPSKTLALLYGTKLARRKAKYALYIDDDVELPHNFQVRRKYFKESKVRGLIYPILAKAGSGDNSLLIKWQNIEYQLSDLVLTAHEL